jgi:hypothetical protein
MDSIVLGMLPATLALKSKINLEGTETEKRLAAMLFDDTVQVLSTFELNQIASLTYCDEPLDQILELLAEIMATAADHSVLCVQKSLVVARHVLIYGSEKTVRSIWSLRSHVEALQEYNTVLAAQQKKGVGALWLNIKGGSVDRGLPVREAATKLNELLQSEQQLREVRNDKADPNSLVPVGDDRVAFVSDEVRLFMLKKRMEEQSMMITRSNLAKAEGGFGAGYASRDGKNVVGAAHSIEEMVARAEREKKKFSDDGPVHYKAKPKKAEPGVTQTVDLLDFGAPIPAVQPEVDLLGFHVTSAASTSSTPTLDIFASAPLPQQEDLLGTTSAFTTTQQSSVNEVADVFSLMTVAPTSDAPVSNPLQEKSVANDNAPASDTEPTVKAKPSVMSSNADRFAALDALEPPGVSHDASKLSVLEAENRILSYSGDDSTARKQAGEAVMVSTSEMMEMGGVMGGEPSSIMGGVGPSSNGALMGAMTMKAMISGMNGLGGAPSVAPPPSVPPPIPSEPPLPPPADEPIRIQVAAHFGDNDDDDDDSGFVMGGAIGTGLGEPTVAMPSVPPPPPPMF